MNEADFLRAIQDNPQDHDLYRVYADWLEEQASPKATYVRLVQQRKQSETRLREIQQELKAIRPELDPKWAAQVFPHSGIQPGISWYQLNDGRKIQIDAIRQWFTYESMLAGIPTDRINQRIVEQVLERESGSPYLVPPRIRPLEISSRDWETFELEGETPEKLPEVACAAKFISYDPVRNEDEDASQLTVLWFQDDFAFPIDPEVVEQIADIDWESLATNFSW